MAKKGGNPANLKKNLTPDEARENGRKGGIKSGEVRRARRDARQAALRLLEMDAKGKMLQNLIEMGYDPDDEEGAKNVDVVVARLLVLSASGNLNATDKLLKIAGYDSEENRAERESINADRRKERESKARLRAIENGDVQMHSSSYTDNDDDGSVEDVFIYLPDNGRDKDLQNVLPENKVNDTEADGTEDTEKTQNCSEK